MPFSKVLKNTSMVLVSTTCWAQPLVMIKGCLRSLASSLISQNSWMSNYGKLGFVEMRSTPFMFRSMAWGLSSVEQLRAG